MLIYYINRMPKNNTINIIICQQYFNIEQHNLVMILRRLLNISLIPKKTNSNLNLSYLFSSSLGQKQQPEVVEAQLQSQQVQEQAQYFKQAAKNAAPKKYQGKHKYQRNHQKNFDKSSNRQYDQQDNQIYRKFALSLKTQPKIDQATFLQKLGQPKSMEDLHEKMHNLYQQLQKSQQQQLQKPLSNYEKRLGLSLEVLTSSKIKLQGDKSKQQISARNFVHFEDEVIKSLYTNLEGLEFKERDFYKIILGYVALHPSKNFLVNFILEMGIINPNTLKTTNISLQDLKPLRNCSQYPHINPLKLFWYMTKQASDPIASQSLYKQLNKLWINNKNAAKKLRDVSYFFLGGELSTKLVTALVGSCESLGELVEFWVLSMMVLGRIMTAVEANGGFGAQANFNDLLRLEKSSERCRQLLMNLLTKVLVESAPTPILLTYKNALKHYQLHPKQQKNIQYSQLQKHLNIKFPINTETLIQYRFQHDPRTLSVEFLAEAVGSEKVGSKDKGLGRDKGKGKETESQNNNYKFKSNQVTLIENIVKGNYIAALNYCKKNFINQSEKFQNFQKYVQKAQSEIQDQNFRALYILKQFFKQTSKNIVFSNKYVLTESKLQKFLNPSTSQRNRRQNSSRNQLFSNKQRKNNDKDPQFKRKVFSNNENQEMEQSNNNIQQESIQKVASEQNNNKDENQQNQNVEQNSQAKQQKKPETKGKQKKFGKRQKVGIFKNKNSFCSNKQKSNQYDEKPTKQQTDKHYEEYLKVVKQTELQNKQQPSQKKQEVFNFKDCNTISQIQQQFKKNLHKITETNIKQILSAYKSMAFVGSIKNLIKYFFLTSSSTSESIPYSNLTAQFKSSSGQISKDYSKYLKGCPFSFALPTQLYNELLDDQSSGLKRQQFKRIVAHLLYYKQEIEDAIINKICDICAKQRAGLTLLEIIYLINARQIKISYLGLKKIASSVQNFKNMQSDLLQFVKKYCQRSNIQIQTKLFQPYISNLTNTQKYDSLNDFFQVLRQQFKPKQYKINEKLSPEQNLKAQKAHKQRQLQRSNAQLFEMIRIVAKSFKARTKIPNFITEIFQLYLSRNNKEMGAQEYGVSLIVYSQDEQKFIQILDGIRNNPDKNDAFVLESAIMALELFGRGLKNQLERVLRSVLFQKQHDLSEYQLKKLGFVFKELDSPGAYGQYLQYILKKQPKSNIEIKNLYYKIFNLTTDDHAKNQISGLLDFIFNPSRQKERIQYKNVKIQEERKQKILKNMNKLALQKVKEEQQLAKKNQKQKEVPSQQKSAPKQKKKTKKQQKKAAKSEQKPNNEIKLQQKSKKKNELKPGFDKIDKRIAKQLIKINSAFQYNQSNDIVYHKRFSRRDERTSSLNMFIDIFLNRFQEVADQDQDEKQIGKKSKGKQVAKQTKKKAEVQSQKKK